jgi:cardiolipin synthase A/B
LPRYELLVGSGPFWERASRDIGTARHRVLVQAMTFEGDAAGSGVAAAIAGSSASDRRVLVDDYSRHVINDSFLALSRDPAIHSEAQATWAMFDGLIASGAALRITNPVGRNLPSYAMRNHKKLIVTDGVAWIGGINFSDHNFAWHDMMLRIEDAQIADWLADQFGRDWTGVPQSAQHSFGDTFGLLSLDGRSNPAALQPLLALFRTARQSIEVISAYPTFPFLDALAESARRGVPVTVYTPRANNKPIIRDYLMGVAERSGLTIRLVPEMSHVKAALIDGEVLVAGSSNFDFVSYRANSEYIATIRDPDLIADFRLRLLAPIQAAAALPVATDHSRWRSLRARTALRSADKAIGYLRHGKRIAEWVRP